MNSSLTLLLESAWHASIIPFGNDATYFAMKAFGGQDMGLPFILSVTGAMLGQLFNLLIGITLIKLNKDTHTLPERVEKYLPYFRRHGHYALLFSWVPLCNLLTVAAGMARIPLWRALPLLLLGEMAYYSNGWW